MLIFVLLFLPYTLLLLFDQWPAGHITPETLLVGQQCQTETFHGPIPCPYKAKHRYWHGLLLVLRFALLLVFASSPQQDPSINLLAIQVGAGMLVIWAWMSGGVYRSWYLDALEGSFALNFLFILVGATYHVKRSEDQLPLGTPLSP